MSIPTETLEWATDPGAVNVEPAPSKKAIGHVAGEQPPEGFENWAKAKIEEWLLWLQSRYTDDDENFVFRNEDLATIFEAIRTGNILQISAALEIFSTTVMQDTLTFNKTLAVTNILMDLMQGYQLLSDNTGGGTANSRLWINGPDEGEMHLGPRAGNANLHLLKMYASDLVLNKKVGNGVSGPAVNINTRVATLNELHGDAGIPAGQVINSGAAPIILSANQFIPQDVKTAASWIVGASMTYEIAASNPDAGFALTIQSAGPGIGFITVAESGQPTVIETDNSLTRKTITGLWRVSVIQGDATDAYNIGGIWLPGYTKNVSILEGSTWHYRIA